MTDKYIKDEISKSLDTIVKCNNFGLSSFHIYDLYEFNLVKNTIMDSIDAHIKDLLPYYNNKINYIEKRKFIYYLTSEIETIFKNELSKIQQISGSIGEDRKIKITTRKGDISNIKSSIARDLNKNNFINIFFKNTGRLDKETFLSVITDTVSEGLSTGNTAIRFPKPDINDESTFNKEYFDKLKTMVEKSNVDTNAPDILLIPISNKKHITTLIVNRKNFPNENSCMLFDSSHYFNIEKDFCKEFKVALGNKNKSINDKAPQKLEGTCSFYTEACLILLDKYIQNNKNCTLENIANYINNTKEFKKEEKAREKKFGNFISNVEKLKNIHFKNYFAPEKSKKIRQNIGGDQKHITDINEKIEEFISSVCNQQTGVLSITATTGLPIITTNDLPQTGDIKQPQTEDTTEQPQTEDTKPPQIGDTKQPQTEDTKQPQTEYNDLLEATEQMNDILQEKGEGITK